MKLRTTIGRFVLDRRLIGLLVLAAFALAARGWLHDHPQHNPWAPLEIDHPPGWATATKISALRSDLSACRAVLERGEVAFTALPPAGEGQCARFDRTALTGLSLAPSGPQMTCPVATGLALWLRHSVNPAAENILGSPVRRIEHLGTWSCRRIGGGEQGNWSEHATGNAIDIAAFVLEDGRRISVLADWGGSPEEQAFLRQVRDGACGSFATVLSPDYNAAHADHFHFDQAERMIGGVCR
ncbi:extensin family protein [Altererythrobacter sp. H2]|uniref:extensin-like domain-containing protein n=1 Tax=Altererythrobacter sp. H2 TaxID=3108391 RepID=UPI000BC6C3DD|nr:extensin family protein [Altererythrobacter sp. H2]OZA91522.1 MAG: extensin [Erythrobacter sp. 34-65-8]WRK94851.1 extensin family protein [Altererythrobacter sp. H2]